MPTKKPHTPYLQKLKRDPDFRVEYEFIRNNLGAEDQGLFQGMQCEWWYAEDGPDEALWLVMPEFLDEGGGIIPHRDHPIAEIGHACLWFAHRSKRKVHAERLKIGAEGYFMVGPHPVAKARVVELISITAELAPAPKRVRKPKEAVEAAAPPAKAVEPKKPAAKPKKT